MKEFLKKWNLQLFADAGSVVNASIGYVNASTGNTTAFSGTNTLSPDMKDYYDTTLLENYRVKKIYAQFGKHITLPKRHGKTAEFRKFNTFARANKLTEGAIPTGQKMGITTVNAAIAQYGTYVTISDILELRAYDDIIDAATVEMAASMNESQEILTRDALLVGTNVLYCPNIDLSSGAIVNQATDPKELADGGALEHATLVREATGITDAKMAGAYEVFSKRGANTDLVTFGTAVNHVSGTYVFTYNTSGTTWKLDSTSVTLSNYGITTTGSAANGDKITVVYEYLPHALSKLTPDAIPAIVTEFRRKKVPTIGNWYVAVIHPSVAHDLRNCQEWVDLHKYDASTQIFNGEIGELHGVRFIMNPDAPVMGKAALNPANDDNYSTMNRRRCYATYFFGADAFGIIDPEGGNAEMIVHSKDDIGGPLDQFSTIGYKFESNGATILYPERLLRVMSCSTYSDLDAQNNTYSDTYA